jgi:hypothetical protein
VDLGAHGGVCGLATEGAMPDGSREEGRRQDYSTRNRWCVAHRSGDPGRRPVMTEVLLRSISAVSGCGQRSADVAEHRQRRRTKVDKHG